MMGDTLMSLVPIIGMVLGFILSKMPNVEKKLVPAWLFVIAFLKNIAVAAGFFPEVASPLMAPTAEAIGVDSTLALAGFWSRLVAILITSILEASMPVGVYSGVKNALQTRKAS